jgi:aspartate-semialdehyde dehydrogenase
VETEYGELTIEEFSIEESRKCHFVFLAVSGEFALENAPKITENNGPYVIDNSSAFRYHPEIPLVASFIF